MTKKITLLLALFIATQLSWAQQVSDISFKPSLKRYALPSVDNTLSLEVKNNGKYDISSLEINWTDGDENHSATVNTRIAAGKTAMVKHPVAINYNAIAEKKINVSVSKVNGSNNFNVIGDQSETLRFNTITRSGKKVVIFEYITGTWCMYCTRGFASTEHMEKKYPKDKFVVVSIHRQEGNDPMALDSYAKAIPIIGPPGCNVDRKLIRKHVTRELWEGFYEERKDLETPVDIYAKGTKNGRNITITASAKYYTDFREANHRFGVIVMEDGVTGTTEDYNQANYYGKTGDEMGGWEKKGHPIPAKDMVYNHVARATLGGVPGQENSVPKSISAGQTVEHKFEYTVPNEFDIDNLHFVVVLIDDNDKQEYKNGLGQMVKTESGSIINGKKFDWGNLLSVDKYSQTMDNVNMFPNPVSDNLTIALTDAKSGNYNVTITDMIGRTVLQKAYNNVSGSKNLSLPLSSISNGTYIVNITNGEAAYSKMILVE